MRGQLNGIVWEESGVPEGIPLIFIHAFPLNRSMWEAQAQVLSTVCRILRYDVRGFGESEAGDGQYTIEIFVDDLLALMDERQIKVAVLCGLSMGGYIALRAVERTPERFSGLILCDTKSEADGNEAKIKRTAALKTAKQKGVEVFAEQFLKTTLTEKTLTKHKDITENICEMIRRSSVTGIAGALLAMAARTDTTGILSQLKIPVLFLVGEQDKLTPPTAAESMQKLVHNSKLVVIPEAAHLSNLENPSFFNEKILEFFVQMTSPTSY